MSNYHKTKEIVDEFVKYNGTDVKMTRSEFINWIHEKCPDISIEKNNMSPTDICYNNYNNGLKDFPNGPLCLEYIDEGKGMFRLIGSEYLYTGPVYQYRNSKKEKIVGNWFDGTFSWGDAQTDIINDKSTVINQTIQIQLQEFESIVHEGEEEILQKVRQFVEDYTVLKLLKLPKESFVYGSGRKDTFCYRITHELMGWGSIRNGTPNKYGFYYDPNDKKYCVATKFGGTDTEKQTEDAYYNVKQAIYDLIVAGGQENYVEIHNNKLSTIFKGKLLSTYYPDKYINIYSKEHMKFYMDILDIQYFADENYMLWNKRIIEWKEQNSIAKNWTNHEFSKFLYHGIGYPPDSEQFKKKMRKQENKLDETLKAEVEELIENNSVSQFEYIPKPEMRSVPIIAGESYSYPRNKQVALNALIRANYQCECQTDEEKHPGFIRKSNGTNYTEPHHLIPMSEQDRYENSLDVPANIISLCSNCHNFLHYGKEPQELLTKLYEMRKNELKEAGIEITLDKLISIYV